MSYKSIVPTSRTSITMSDFIGLIHKQIDTELIKTIVDAGSLDGNDAYILWKEFPYAKSYAIEGLPDNFEKYIKNKKDIIGIHAVIAPQDGEIQYYQKEVNGIHGIFDRGEQYGTKTLVLPCYTMATIMNNYNISAIDVMKIDVEGATFELLQSLENNLEDIKIIHIETETYAFFKGQKLHEYVCDQLEKKNFECVDMTYVEITPSNYQSDSVWVNKKQKK